MRDPITTDHSEICNLENQPQCTRSQKHTSGEFKILKCNRRGHANYLKLMIKAWILHHGITLPSRFSVRFHKIFMLFFIKFLLFNKNSERISTFWWENVIICIYETRNDSFCSGWNFSFCLASIFIFWWSTRVSTGVLTSKNVIRVSDFFEFWSEPKLFLYLSR